MKSLPKLIRSFWLVALLALFGLCSTASAPGMTVPAIAYDEGALPTVAYDVPSLSVFDYDVAPALPANERERRGAETSGVFAGFSSFLAAEGGRLGSDLTRGHVADVAAEMESRGWKITGGGGKLPEEYMRGPNGRLGSSYPDITATKNGRTLRVNTVDTYANGITPTAREAANAARIRAQTPGDHLLLVPKP